MEIKSPTRQREEVIIDADERFSALKNLLKSHQMFT